MSEADILTLLVGFTGANEHALTHYIVAREVAEGRTIKIGGAVKLKREVHRYLEEKHRDALHSGDSKGALRPLRAAQG